MRGLVPPGEFDGGAEDDSPALLRSSVECWERGWDYRVIDATFAHGIDPNELVAVPAGLLELMIGQINNLHQDINALRSDMEENQ